MLVRLVALGRCYLSVVLSPGVDISPELPVRSHFSGSCHSYVCVRPLSAGIPWQQRTSGEASPRGTRRWAVRSVRQRVVLNLEPYEVLHLMAIRKDFVVY